MIGVTIGSVIGGYIPTFFGADLLSMTSVIGNALGGILGLYVTYKLTSDM